LHCCQLFYVVEDDIGSVVFVKNCIFGPVNEAAGCGEIVNGNALNGKILHIENRYEGFKILCFASAVFADKEDFGHVYPLKMIDLYFDSRFGESLGLKT